jgi:hypothetical protein
MADGTNTYHLRIAIQIVCAGGQPGSVDASAAMLEPGPAVEGASAVWRFRAALARSRRSEVNPARSRLRDPTLPRSRPSSTVPLQIRRIKRAAPRPRVGVAIWRMPVEVHRDGGRIPPPVGSAKIAKAEPLGDGFVATGFNGVMEVAFVYTAFSKTGEGRRQGAPVSRRVRSRAV